MTNIYAYPIANQTMGFNELVGYVNNVTGGMFFPLILLAMFIITFVSTMNFGNSNAFVFACFFNSLIAIFLVIAGLLNPMYMYLLFVMLAVGLLLLRIGKSSTLPQI